MTLFDNLFKSPEEKDREQIEEQKRVRWAFEYPQHLRIINESLDLINKTKNVDTGISRFETIKYSLGKILEIAPATIKLGIKIQERAISTKEDLPMIDQARQEWVSLFFKEKTESELNKANLLTDAKLQKAQLKKALNVSLKSLDYVSENDNIKKTISDIESRMNALK